MLLPRRLPLTTDLREADLSKVFQLTQEQLDSAGAYEGAKLPDYLQEGASHGPGDEPNA